MAGGGGERMRASGVELPKPLVPVAGVPLIEWNLRALLLHGLDQVVVAVPGGESAIGDYARERLAPVAAAAGAGLRVLTEATPLGNIGCAGMLRDEGDVLVVFADNVTALDLRALLDHHLASGAAMTLASHDEPFQLPYGRIELAGGDQVVAYTEKPELAVTVSSGTAVLSPDATALVPTDAPTGMADLARELLEAGLPVRAFRHQAPWVDVNDAAAVPRAERLIEQHAAAFASAPRS
jgi:NDP-sugar pyrophosphorylase family protein